MSVTEKLMAMGQFSITLKRDAPEQLVDLIDYMDHVVITSQRLSPFSWSTFSTPPIADANLLAISRYVGVIMKLPIGDRLGFSGKGLVWWLGDQEGRGLVLRDANKLSFVNKSFQIGVQDITNVTGSPLSPGAVEATSGTYSHIYDFVSQRFALEHFLASFGAEFRVNNNFLLDAGASGFLFVDPPTTTIARKFGGDDTKTDGLKARSIEVLSDAEDYLTKAIVVGEGTGVTLQTGEATLSPATNYYAPNGISLIREVVINEPDTPSADATDRAKTFLASKGIRRNVTLRTNDYHIQGQFRVGDLLNVWDPKTELVDPTNELSFRGQILNPISIRCVGLSWPIKRGMGVYIRRSGTTPSYVDITDYVEWESGDVSVEVGATGRNLIEGTSEALLARITIDPDGNDRTGPNDPTHASTPWSTVGYLDASGIRHSRIIPVWDLPTNTDGTVVTDGSHYTIRYRPSGQTVYSFIDVPWGNLQASIDSLSPGTLYEISVAACDLNGNCSGYDSDQSITAAQAGANPSQPSVPTVSGNPLNVQVVHDLTKQSGGSLDSDLDHLEVHASLTSNFVPSSGTLLGTLPATAAHITLGLSVIGTFPFKDTLSRRFRVVAVDREGNASAPSPQATVSATLINTQQIADLAVTDAKIGSLSVDKLVGAEIDTTEITVGSELTLDGSGVIRTADSGQRVEITALNRDRIAFHSGDALEPANGPSHILADSYGGTDPAPQLVIRGPQADWGPNTPVGSWYSNYRQPHEQAGNPALEIGYDGESTGVPRMLLNEHMVLGPGSQIFLSPDTDDPAQAIMPGVLTKLDPPTWKADTTDPTPSAYDDNSVGFWIRVGNIVWFSITFVFNDTGVSTSDDGSGDYYWNPALDGAPGIDSDIYTNAENQLMACGSGYTRGQSGSPFDEVVCEIDNTNSRIYANEGNNRVSNRQPFNWEEGDRLAMTGTYAAMP